MSLHVYKALSHRSHFQRGDLCGSQAGVHLSVTGGESRAWGGQSSAVSGHSWLVAGGEPLTAPLRARVGRGETATH